MHKNRHIRLGFLLVLVLFLLACGTSTPTVSPPSPVPPTQTPVPPTATLQPTLTPTLELAKIFPINNTNCRNGPSTDYPVQVSLTAGSEVKVLALSADGQYYFVENPQSAGNGCWVKGSLVTIFGSITFLPVFTPPAVPTANYPTSAPATAAPACGEASTITINNTTGGQLTLYLNGPYKYSFRLGGGYTYLEVCAGSYSYTA